MTPYIARHTFARNLPNAGVRLEKGAMLKVHSSLDPSLVYNASKRYLEKTGGILDGSRFIVDRADIAFSCLLPDDSLSNLLRFFFCLCFDRPHLIITITPPAVSRSPVVRLDSISGGERFGE
jgi:hypothetical protein